MMKHYITLLLAITLSNQTCTMDFSKMSQQEKDVRLVDATNTNDHDTLALLIKNKANVNTPDLIANTPLMHAAYHGFLSIAQLLVEAKADVNYSNYMNNTALHSAVRTRHSCCNTNTQNLSMVQFLLEAKADINHLDCLKTSALCEAVRCQKALLTEFLILKRAEINIIHWFGKSILMEAAQGESTKIVLALLNAKADVNYTSQEYGDTALMLARRIGRDAIVKLLLEHKANA